MPDIDALRTRVERDSATVRIVLLDAAIVAVVGFSLWIIWVWFGSRNKPDGPVTRSEAST